jgi:hypothetical protein
MVRAAGLLIELAPNVFGSQPINDSSKALCEALGATDQFTNVACYGWYAVIALNAALVLNASVERPLFTQPEPRFEIIRKEEYAVWSCAFLSIVPPLIQRSFGVIDSTGFERYDCWIKNGTSPPIGQIVNFLSFVVACAMGIVLLVMIVRDRKRVSNFSDTLKQSVLFTGTFLTLWIIQHIADFQDFVGVKDVAPLWQVCNHVLKGVGGMVTFFTWFNSNALSRAGDDVEVKGPPMESYGRLSDLSSSTDHPPWPSETVRGSGGCYVVDVPPVYDEYNEEHAPTRSEGRRSSKGALSREASAPSLVKLVTDIDEEAWLDGREVN